MNSHKQEKRFDSFKFYLTVSPCGANYSLIFILVSAYEITSIRKRIDDTGNS